VDQNRSDLSQEKALKPTSKMAEERLMRYRLVIVWSFQLLAVLASYTLAFFLRFELSLPREFWALFMMAIPIHAVCRLTSYYYYQIDASSWRFASIQDLMSILKATALGSVGIIVILSFTTRLQGFPRSVLILEPLINLALLTGPRLLVRHYQQVKGNQIQKKLKYVLIAGAGKAGFLLLKEIQSNPHLGIHVVGCVDDDPFKRKTSLLGVPVLGNSGEIPRIASHHTIDEIIIAMPSADYKDVVRVKTIAQSTQIKTLVLPSLSELISDKKFTSQLRDVSCEELLGRGVIKFCRESDRQVLEAEIKGKAILVTGAGGSIGSELCRQVAQLGPDILILYERYESSLYDLELDLKRDFPDVSVLPVLGDILDSEKLMRVLRENQVDLIYHAAAYKHVPMMEREPMEAVRNNVLGTLNVARMASKAGVGKFVLISTDKAVRPASIMGATKRIAELIVEALGGNGTRYVAVRFGNVLGSNGSVIPLFKKQISAGGPVTVTHPEATRYFMSISEAVQLVMIAGTMGTGGEIFLLDMGEPVLIVDLARNLIKLSGLQPDKDVDVVFTGLRAGEKLHEELYWEGEGIAATANRKITVWRSDDDVDRNLFFTQISRLEERASKRDTNGAVSLLCEIVPEAELNPVECHLGPAAASTRLIPLRAGTAAKREPRTPRGLEVAVKANMV
jgi:FlaA1/EpsC-like NDP-sugar epimerase